MSTRLPTTRAVVDTDVVSFLFKRDSRAELYRRHLTGALLTISFMTLAELERWTLEHNVLGAVGRPIVGSLHLSEPAGRWGIMAEVRAARYRTSRIVRDQNVLGGEPTVAGTRVPVRSIVIGLDRYGGDVARVSRAYRLDVETVREAVAYYDRHRDEIDALIRDNELAAESTDE